MSKISKEQVNQALANISQNMSNRPFPILRLNGRVHF